VVVRGASGPRRAPRRRRGALPLGLRALPSASVQPLPRADRSDQPLQHGLSDLLRQRRRRRLRRRAGFRGGRAAVADPARPAPASMHGHSVHRRGAHAAPGVPADRLGREGHGLQPHPDGHERHPPGGGGLRRPGGRGGTPHALPPVRRGGRRGPPPHSEPSGPVGQEARLHRELPQDRDQDLSRAHRRQGRQRRRGGEYLPLRRREHRRHQRHQLSTGLVHRADGGRAATRPTVYPRRPGARHCRRLGGQPAGAISSSRRRARPIRSPR